MINDSMRITGFKDFYERRNIILGKYRTLRPEDKIIYKYYIYSRRYLREKLCDAMWEYLNAVSLEEAADASLRLLQGYMKHQCEVPYDNKYY